VLGFDAEFTSMAMSLMSRGRISRGRAADLGIVPGTREEARSICYLSAKSGNPGSRRRSCEDDSADVSVISDQLVWKNRHLVIFPVILWCLKSRSHIGSRLISIDLSLQSSSSLLLVPWFRFESTLCSFKMPKSMISSASAHKSDSRLSSNVSVMASRARQAWTFLPASAINNAAEYMLWAFGRLSSLQQWQIILIIRINSIG